jgi:UDP-3-O-[3-hydroxymyristoyl] glucosamine N-acyltransferase
MSTSAQSIFLSGASPKLRFSEFVHKLGLPRSQTSLEVLPSLEPILEGVAAVHLAAVGSLSFIEGPQFAHHLSQTQASAIILPPNQALQDLATARQIAWIVTPHPRLLFAQAIALFYQPFAPAAGIDPSAVIHPTVQLGAGVSIAAQVVIQAGVKLGDGVLIHPHVVIYPQVSIGDRTVLHANCVIHERTQIGADCVIQSGAAIGAEGFGFVPTPEGWFKMPQSGYTVLEDGVEVGCNTAIDRPAVGETRIGRGTKIDNLVQIGHGCQIGPNCAIAGQTGLAGRVSLGKGVILAGQVGIVDQVEVGAGAIVTAQSGVHSSIPAGAIFGGSPALPQKQFLKLNAVQTRLPDLYRWVKQLQRQQSSAPEPPNQI